MPSHCSCGLPWHDRNGALICSHCDAGSTHIAVACGRCRVIAPPKL